MNFTERPELNNPQVWFTFDNSIKKAGQNDLQFTSSFGGKNVENPRSNDSGQRGSF